MSDPRLPEAHGGCTCMCHHVAGIRHVAPCCSPGRLPEATLRYYATVAAVEEALERERPGLEIQEKLEKK